MDDDRTPQSRSKFPQTFFRGKVTSDGIPIVERLTVSDEAERMRALSEGWSQEERNAVEHSLREKLAYEEQQRRDHQAASRRRDELLGQALPKLLSRLEETPPPGRGDPDRRRKPRRKHRTPVRRRKASPSGKPDLQAYPQRITKSLIEHRLKLLKVCRDEEGLRAAAFYRKIGFGKSTISAAVHENPRVCPLDTRNELLRAVQISVDRWYDR